MSQTNLDSCREITRTLVDKKTKDSLNTTLDRLQIKVDAMRDELLSEQRDQGEQDGETKMGDDDELNAVAKSWPGDGMLSPPYSSKDIQADVGFDFAARLKLPGGDGPDDGMFSPPYSSKDIQADVDFNFAARLELPGDDGDDELEQSVPSVFQTNEPEDGGPVLEQMVDKMTLD